MLRVRRFVLALVVLCTTATPLFAGDGKISRASKHVEDLYLVVLDERMISRVHVPEVAQRLTKEHGS